MECNIRALAVALGIIFGGSFLLVGIANMIFPPYATAYLELAASVYPGYSGPAGFGSVIAVTLYGALDGVVGGAIFAWLYNFALGKKAAAAT